MAPGHGTVRRAAKKTAPSPELPARTARVDYPSPVCSTTGDEIGRIAAAIDQLATDMHNQAGEPELAMRVAVIWQMISALDPELDRRRRGYAPPADGVPTA